MSSATTPSPRKADQDPTMRLSSLGARDQSPKSASQPGIHVCGTAKLDGDCPSTYRSHIVSKACSTCRLNRSVSKSAQVSRCDSSLLRSDRKRSGEPARL